MGCSRRSVGFKVREGRRKMRDPGETYDGVLYNILGSALPIGRSEKAEPKLQLLLHARAHAVDGQLVALAAVENVSRGDHEGLL